MSDTRGLSRDRLTEAPVRDALEKVARLAASLRDAPMAAVAVLDPAGTWVNFCAGAGEEWWNRELPGSRAGLWSQGKYHLSLSADAAPMPGLVSCTGLPFIAGEFKGVLLIFDLNSRVFTAGEVSDLERLRTAAANALLLPEGRAQPADGQEVVLTLDLAGRLTSISRDLEGAGYSASELLGSQILDLVPKDHREEVRDRLLAQLGGSAGGFDVPVETKRGDRVLLTFRTRLLFNEGKPTGIRALCRDITSPGAMGRQRREAESKLEAKTAQLTRFSENLRELQRLSVSRRATIKELCRDYLESGCAMFGAGRGRIVGERVLVGWPGESDEAFEPMVSARLVAGARTFGVLEFGGGTGQAFEAREQDILDLMARAVAHALESEEWRRERDEQLRRDPLTGLPNRRALFEELERVKGGYAIAFIDLDRFKQINDTLGHAAGDELLRQFARRLESLAGPGEPIARIGGGDEFVLVLTREPSDAAIGKRVAKMLERMREPYVVIGYELFLTASIGVSVAPRDGNDAEQLLQCADAAMYRAKANGRNSFELFTADMSARTMNRLELETELWRAVENKELEMRLQPIFSLEGSLEGLEALLAWDNPKFGKVGPARFIPIAEETGMIVGLGEWVLRQACEQTMRWLRAGMVPPRIAVNVSAVQFTRADFVDLVGRVLLETGVPPQYLELELTESLVMRDVEEAGRRMKRLRALGVSMTIDDFGTGHSSLNYLRQLPVDALKIDRSFSAEMLSSSSTLPLIQTIVVLAHNMGLSVVAEGVETDEQLALLRAIGCDKVQGHLFGEALPPEAVTGMFRRAARA